MAKQNKVRSKADSDINQGAVINSSVDLLTLKRMYPKRFLSEIIETEGYEETMYNKFKKRQGSDEG